ncbi:Iron-sulfur cluster-binding protein [Helicobacter bizzozeronii CCUG 35545]|nr:Iron-sulfur cluster-binding protein [Helicobacter bizzozeronii CCUG 35545]
MLENSTQDPLDLANSLSLLYEVHGLQFDFDTTKHTPTPEGLLSEFFSYNQEICQYHQRRVECCAKCSEVCPTEAITKLDPQIAQDKGMECADNRHLIIDHQACIDCGKCISVCPSGSLSYGGFSLECVQEVAKLYRGYVPLLLDHQAELPSTPLKKEILPLCVNLNILEQVALITLLQESGSQIVIYAPQELGVGTLQSIALLNGIYAQLYQQEAILLASDLQSLQACLQRAQRLESTHFTPPPPPRAPSGIYLPSASSTP